jgi:hypothetical protein
MMVAGLALVRDEQSVQVLWDGKELLRYVYRPWDAQLESPRPYLHPVRTLAGDVITLYRPHDHVWHKGIAWSLPNVGPANFWGGVTYLRDGGYQQLPNNGTQRHDSFESLETRAEESVHIGQTLEWITEPGELWFTERRRLRITVDAAAGAWTLGFASSMTNVSGREIRIGSPTTEGRPNAGYGGLFWRGPRSFSGGAVHVPGVTGGDELMGVRAPWLGFTGRHDDHGRASTLVFVDAPDNPGHPTQWFVRTGIYACLCPAPFFAEEVPVGPGEVLTHRYAVVIADGDHDGDAVALLAKSGLAALSEV